jgi:signal transduction histidine kinase
MPLRRLVRSYGFLLTVLYVGLCGASVAAVFTVVYGLSAEFMRDEVHFELGTEIASLMHDLKATSADVLAEEIEERLPSPADQDPIRFYLLQDASSRKMAGNLPAMPAFEGWRRLLIPAELGGEDSSDTFTALGQPLSNGWFLVVGRDTDRFTDFESSMIDVTGWSLAGAFALALAGGLAISAALRRRVQAIADAARRIMDGDLRQRVPVRGTDDEFDRLSIGLNAMLARIEVLMEDLRQVTNDIAHDLRTPLTRLRQRLEGARRKATSLAEYQTAVDRAIGDTDDILATFSALLRIAQIEAGTRRAGFTGVDLSALVRTIVETYAAVADDQQRALAGTVADGVTVHGDRQLLMQMLANIVENALRHTPPGTRVEVKLEPGPAGAVCTIADDGPGIPERERERVFQRFYRLDASRAASGSGLGLSLVAAVAGLHGIAVDIGDNRPGLRIALRFPVAAGVQPAGIVAIAPRAAPL